MKKYIIHENLKNLGYDQKICHELYTLHHPTKEVHSIDPFLATLKFVEITSHLIDLQKNRRYTPVSPLIPCDPTAFIVSLPFNLTDDQKKAIDQLFHDFSQSFQAKRMIIGDVGCGKTMVILAAAFMISPHKSAILAPTSILANQLYEEAKKHLPSDFKITLLTQKTKSKKTLEELQNATLIIGTHALLYTPLPSLRLLAIDEQHRFGTAQRNLLATLTDTTLSPPHIIQFSATPIPRTQAMIQSSLIDVTLIKEIPFTKNITTSIITPQDFNDLIAHIENERLKGHQTIIVYPLVEASETINYQSLEEAKGYWLAHYDDTMITHGKDRDKEEILENFKNKGSILLTTTVIEVGISLPRLTTIVIVGAERLGLATLHQLRGRVGRVGLDGNCFLFTKSTEQKRLVEFCQTTSGFDIAELDLRYRQSGDLIIGKEQSGKSFKYINIAEDHEIVKNGKEWIYKKNI
jgi:ATP-dependent DNA helicase RecG